MRVPRGITAKLVDWHVVRAGLGEQVWGADGTVRGGGYPGSQPSYIVDWHVGGVLVQGQQCSGEAQMTEAEWHVLAEKLTELYGV